MISFGQTSEPLLSKHFVTVGGQTLFIGDPRMADPVEQESGTEHLILKAGHTSLSERVANLIESGRNYDAISVLETALNNADEKTIGKVAKIAIEAHELMAKDHPEQATVLRSILSDFGVDVDNKAREPAPNAVPAFSFAPAVPGA